MKSLVQNVPVSLTARTTEKVKEDKKPQLKPLVNGRVKRRKEKLKQMCAFEENKNRDI